MSLEILNMDPGHTFGSLAPAHRERGERQRRYARAALALHRYVGIVLSSAQDRSSSFFQAWDNTDDALRGILGLRRVD